MATLKPTGGAQYPLEATFSFTMADAMKTTAGVLTNFKATAGVFDVIPLPYGAQVTGGDLTVLTVSNDTGTSTVSIGDSASATRYLGATSLKSLARTALVPTGYQSLGESLQLTIANNTGDATTGSFVVRVAFIIASRQNENLRIVDPASYLAA